MATAYPAALDTFETDHADGVGEVIEAAFINDPAGAVNQLERKVGIGASTPIANALLTGTASGVSGWAQFFQLGSGDAVNDYSGGAETASRILIRSGTVAAPVTAIGPQVRIEKVEQITLASMVNGQTNEQTAPLNIRVRNTASSEVQVAGAWIYAETFSTQTGGGKNPDAFALLVLGRVAGSGVGTGGGLYAEGRKDTTTGKACGLEARSENRTNTNDSYSATAFDPSQAIWITAGGDAGQSRRSGSAIGVASVNGAQFDVGLGFKKVAGVSSIVTAAISDDSDAVTSLRIGGAHTYAMTVAAAGGKVVIGATSEAHSGAKLEVIGSNATIDPLVSIGNASFQAYYTIRLRNSSGSAIWFIAAASNNGINGTVTGDSGMALSSGRSFLIGQGGGGHGIHVKNNAGTTQLAFFAAAPVNQPSAYTQTYATADKTHANLTAATLTDNSGGTADATLAAVEASYTQATIRNNFADLAAQHNALLADLTDVKQLVNAVIDDMQALGLAA